MKHSGAFKLDSDGEMDEEAIVLSSSSSPSSSPSPSRTREVDENEQWDMVKDVYLGVLNIVQSDDKDQFVNYVRRNCYFGIKGYFRPSFFDDLCQFCAVNCAKALLQGECGLKVCLNLSYGDGSYPLHQVASKFSREFLEVLIDHGARTDVRTKGPEVVEGLLPLNVAVEDTCLHKYLECWANKDSALKLILLLSLPEMKMFLDCVSLLAQHTSQTFDELLNYIQQGKLLQMAVLFIAAHKQIMAIPFQDKDGKIISAVEVILRQIDDIIIFLISEAEQIPLKQKNGLSVNRCKVMLKTLASARLICQLIGNIGDSLEEFRQTLHSEVSHKEVIEYVTSLLAREGFLLNEKDSDLSNLDWYHYPTDRPGETPKLSGRSASLYPPQPDCPDLIQQPVMVLSDNVKIPTIKILWEFHVRRFIPAWNSVMSLRSFMTRPIYENGIIMGYDCFSEEWEKKRAKRPMPSLSEVGPRMKGIVLPRPVYQPSRQYSSVPSLILRLIRRV